MTEGEGLTRKRLTIGDVTYEISEPSPVGVLVADFITECRVLQNGTVALSLGSVVADTNENPEIRVCARLRVSLETLTDIQQAITTQLEAAKKAKEIAN